MSVNEMLWGLRRRLPGRGGTTTAVPERASDEHGRFELRATYGRQLSQITLTGELDLYRTAQVGQAVAFACRDGASTLEMDMSAVTFIDSSGVREIVNAWAQCNERGCTLTLVRSEHPGPTRLFETLGLERMLPLTGRQHATTGGQSAS
jgi:anti-anti-sigma factor